MTHRRERSRLAALALGAAALLALAGCGGGDEAEPESAADRIDRIAATPDGGADPTTPPADAGSGSGAGALLTDADCREYARAFEGVPNIADPGSMTSIGQLADVLDDAAGRMPAEIRDDFQVIADGYRRFADALDELDVDFADPAAMAALGPEDFAALEAAGQAFAASEFAAAGRNIDAFLTENCSG